MRVGLIINPSSRQNRKGKTRLERTLANDGTVMIEKLGPVGTLPNQLARLADAGIEILAVSGGDGSLARILTAIAEGGMFKTLPRISILSHGTTNMTAGDVGLSLSRPEALSDLAAAAANGKLQSARRSTVRITNPKGTTPQHGMFFGAGAIQRAVLDSHTGAHGRGLTGDLANAIVFSRALFRAAAGIPDERPDRIFQPTPMRILANGETMSEGEQLLFFVTSLNRLVLHSRPFWNTGTAPLKATAVGYPVPSLVRSIFTVMYGRNRERLDADIFRSRGIAEAELELRGPFTLDGELFEAPEGEPLRIAAGPQFEFVHGRL